MVPPFPRCPEITDDHRWIQGRGQGGRATIFFLVFSKCFWNVNITLHVHVLLHVLKTEVFIRGEEGGRLSPLFLNFFCSTADDHMMISPCSPKLVLHCRFSSFRLFLEAAVILLHSTVISLALLFLVPYSQIFPHTSLFCRDRASLSLWREGTQ